MKVRNVKDPVRKERENAGIDVYIPEFDSFTIDEIRSLGGCEIDLKNKSIIILPHKDVCIPAGIKSKFNNDIALIANNKSGIAKKHKLIIGASVIDSSYQGEWHIHLFNVSDEPQTILFGQKIVQFVPHLISTDKITVYDGPKDEFYSETTSRGEGRFGSTGIN